MRQNIQPDKDIEEYWYGLKTSVKNSFEKECPVNLDILSKELNILQGLKKYVEIEKQIRTHIATFCYIFMKNSVNVYNCNILLTNIKRWNKISKYLFLTDSDIRKVSRSCILFEIYYKYITGERNSEFDIYFSSLDSKFENIDNLIDLCIKYDRAHLLDKLHNASNICAYINSKYNCTLHQNTSGYKIIRHLKSLNIINK